MIKNIGNKDKILRLIIGVALVTLSIFFKSGFLAIFGIFAIFEALSGWCVFYQLIGKNTCPIKNKNAEKIPFPAIFISGLSILIGAALINILATYLGLTTWHNLLENLGSINEIKIDDLLFLIIVYPFTLGIMGYITYKILNK